MSTKNDDEWEDQYVFVELVGLLDPDKLSLCTTENTALLGVDDEVTVLKLGNYTFAGNYEDSFGSMVFFEETENKSEKSLKYHSHTTKVLKTSRVFLKPKEKLQPLPSELIEKEKYVGSNIEKQVNVPQSKDNTPDIDPIAKEIDYNPENPMDS